MVRAEILSLPWHCVVKSKRKKHEQNQIVLGVVLRYKVKNTAKECKLKYFSYKINKTWDEIYSKRNMINNSVITLHGDRWLLVL